tara:strand:- start:243 stop:788 length:546 start_codon:yes stop_codon:yes gene_type:complete
MSQGPNRRKETILGLILGIFVLGIVSDTLAGGLIGHGRRHHLRDFRGHHGQGFAGKGFCPQTRTTAEAPDDIIEKHNPLRPTREVLYAGESLYQGDVQPVACKICHGVNGNGLGIMAQGLNPSPRNFGCNETMQKVSDGQLFWVIRNGSPGTGMPAFKDLNDREIWQIIHYLRKFSQRLKK